MLYALTAILTFAYFKLLWTVAKRQKTLKEEIAEMREDINELKYIAGDVQSNVHRIYH